MKLKNIVSLIAVVSMVGVGCKKSFVDINQNPNAVTEDKITSELIIPNALENSGSATAIQGLFQRWMGYHSNSGSFSLVEEEVTYNITTSFGSVGTFWNAYFNTLYDFRVIETKAPTEGFPFYAGIAKTMKARLYQDLVDIYGN
ncbi:MAG TPA: SusD/RagB family nutrient-binding outer membrane lipoprotein, partial [Flavisolibacter sp.]|nr:SusD/RagB family nutrient-binding outer membrane lipoprotein [Flavisolibacter sp.]